MEWASLRQAPLETMSRTEVARRVAFVLAEGGEARKELEAAGASLGPEPRAELAETIKVAETVARALEEASPADERSSVRALIEKLSGPYYKETSSTVRAPITSPPKTPCKAQPP